MFLGLLIAALVLVFDQLTKMKYEVPNEDQGKFEAYQQQIDQALEQVSRANS